jgi:TPP-dependent 2-oxoacid decarboxylase
MNSNKKTKKNKKTKGIQYKTKGIQYKTKKHKKTINLGILFSKILLQNGIDVFFGVPSDLNMPILDAMLEEKVKFIGCRNELNASYMAEGFARTKPFAYILVGTMVGSLSAANGFANSICEKNPVLMISGGNNTNDILDGKLSHHTLYSGINDQIKSLEVFTTLAGEDNSFMINSLNTFGIKNTITNISNSLTTFNSAYVQIPVNLQTVKGDFDFSNIISNQFNNTKMNFESFKFYNIVNEWIKINYDSDKTVVSKLKPVFLFGSAYNHYSKFITLADDNFYNLMNDINASMFYTIDAKGILDESNKNVIGYYWGGITEEYKLKYFENATVIVYIGVDFSDYTTSGYTSIFKPNFAINCKNIFINNKQNVRLNKIHLSDTSKTITSSIQDELNSNTDIFVDTGSSWFYGAYLKLPKECRYNISIKYGSIGWCFPASIGNAFANPSRKTICLTGDGAFQCVLQELVTSQTYNVNLTLILINNNVYQIENVLDDRKYNDLPDIDYEAMSKAMNCKSVSTCTIHNFKRTLKKYNALPGFNIVILKVSDHAVDDLMKKWAKLVSAYTTHYP